MQRGSNSNKLCWSGFFRCWALCRALAEQIAQAGWRRGREREDLPCDDARHPRCCRSCIGGCALRRVPRTSSEASDVTSSEASDVYTTTEPPEIETTMPLLCKKCEVQTGSARCVPQHPPFTKQIIEMLR